MQELGPDFALIRWIGDDRNSPQGDRELQVLRGADLAPLGRRIAELTGRGRTVYGYMQPYEATRRPACGVCANC